MSYQDHINGTSQLISGKGGSWDGISAEAVTRMRLQNRFQTGLDIARYTAKIMREDMAAYDADSSRYTQSLGCWHGFIAQQKMIAIKKHFGTTKRKYLYLSGWMVAALRSDFGPLPDQSMHEKTSVPALIEELYTFLRQADARELSLLFRSIDAARSAGDAAKEKALMGQVENFETHVVPIIADIDAGFGNAEATYLLAKKMIVQAPARCKSKTRYPTKNSAATRTARSPFRTRTFWRKFAPAATLSLSWVSRTALSSRALTRWALA